MTECARNHKTQDTQQFLTRSYFGRARIQHKQMVGKERDTCSSRQGVGIQFFFYRRYIYNDKRWTSRVLRSRERDCYIECDIYIYISMYVCLYRYMNVRKYVLAD